MADYHQMGLVHRDLHSMNVMIELEHLKPTEEELEDPMGFYKEILPERKKVAYENLNDPSTFEIKIIDLGLAKQGQKKKKVNVVSSDFGEAFVKPPELNKGENYDDRVDVWYLGICFLIMLSNHKEIMNFNKEFWAVSQKIETEPENI